jgi:hypothetical protein
MKTNRFFRLIAIATIIGATTVGCGTKATSSKPGAKVIALNPVELLQEEAPALRTVGTGISFKEQTAKNMAEMQARAGFARAIESKIKAATSEENFSYETYSSDGTAGTNVKDEGAKQNEAILSIVDGIVRNTVVIKTYKELLADNQYQVWVCLEYQGDVAKMASEITKRIEKQIPEEERMKMNFEYEQFRKRVEEELAKSN